MKFKRKCLIVGNSSAVSLPSDWISMLEEEKGKKITQFIIDVKDDNTAIITPIFE